MIQLQLHPASFVIEYFLDPNPQSTQLPQHESCAEHTDFTRIFAH